LLLSAKSTVTNHVLGTPWQGNSFKKCIDLWTWFLLGLWDHCILKLYPVKSWVWEEYLEIVIWVAAPPYMILR
jgi:hypothetical protein